MVNAVRSLRVLPSIEAHYGKYNSTSLICNYTLLKKLFSYAVNGKVTTVKVNHKDVEFIKKTVEELRAKAGHDPQRLTKWWVSTRPSVQGTWNPFLNNQPFHG